MVVISNFFANFFHCHRFQRLSNYRRGKLQLNATHWTPISNVSMPSHRSPNRNITPQEQKKNQNSLKSCLNTPGREKMTPLNVQESLFSNLLTHWMILMPYPNFNLNSYVSTTVLWATCGLRCDFCRSTSQQEGYKE